MNRSLAVFALVAAAAAAGCAEDGGPVGSARMAVSQVPGDVQCITVAAAGSRTVKQSFPVTPGQSAFLLFEGIPTGLVTFKAAAFPVGCNALTGAHASWLSDPTQVQIQAGFTTDVHLVLHRTGDAIIDIDFDDDGGTTFPVDMGDMAQNPDMQPDAGSCNTLPANHLTGVVAGVEIPTDRTTHAYDLNGDGRKDNQYGNIMGALAAQGFQDDLTIRAAITSGSAITLLELGSHDLNYQLDPCANAVWYAGLATPTPPRFDGSDHFDVDPTVSPGFFPGALSGGNFDSPSPLGSSSPVTTSVLLPFVGVMVRVPLIGAQLSLRPSGPSLSVDGELHGAIRSSDMQGVVIPALAQGLTAFIAANPGSPQAQQLLAVFDTGGTRSPECMLSACINPDRSCAIAGNHEISICELSTSALIQNVLAPDVQMFAADGSFQPNPANTVKDSVSVGIGVHVVPASF
jgi:hypothetical protein